MAGTGPRPKDPSRRAGHSKDPHPTTTLRFEEADPPELPSFEIDKDGNLTEFVWPARTQEWWAVWAASPQAEHFGSTDWEFMLETALLHAAFWSGRLSNAAELRLRVAKFGATPEDRARLRMQFAQADEADAKRPAAGSAGSRYGDLTVVEGEAEAS